MPKRMLVIAFAVFVLGSCASVHREHAPASGWPAEDAPASKFLTIRTESHGAVIRLAVFPAMMRRDGTLVRSVSLTAEQLDNALPVLTFSSCESPYLDATFAVGGGMTSRAGDAITRTYAQPREGLTWGTVAAEEDVVFDIFRQGFDP